MTALVSKGTPVWVPSGTGTATPVLPTGYTLTPGDIAVICFTCVSATAPTTAPNSNWFLAPIQQLGHQTVIARKLTGTSADTLPALTATGGGQCQAICVILDGDTVSDVTTMFDDRQARTSTSTNLIAFPGVTVSAANDYILAFGFRLKTSAGDGETFAIPGAYPAGVTFAQLTAASDQAGNGLCCVVMGYQQTTATSIPLASGIASKTDTNQGCGGVMLAIKTQAAATAAFTIPPSVQSKTSLPTGAYTIGFTPNAAGTIFAVAIAPGAPAPSVAQVKAGQDSLSNAALAAASLAVGSATASAVVLGGALTDPLHDLYFVYHTTVDSAEASLLGQFLQPTSGQQFAVVTSLPGAGVDSILTGASPAAALGDVMECDLTTSPGSFSLSMAGDGAPAYIASTNAPQSFTARLFDLSSGTWSSRVPFTINSPPPLLGGQLGPFGYDLNATITPQPLAGMWQSQSGGTITVSVSDPTTLPPGLFVSGNQLVGAGTASGVYNVALLGEDSNGTSTPASITVIVGLVQIDPAAVGRSQSDETNILLAAFLTPTPVSVPSSNPVGTVITTTPLPGAFVKPFTNVVISIAIPLPDNGGTGSGGTGSGGTGSGGTGSGTGSPGGGNTTPPPITGPIGSTPRSAGMQLAISDLFQFAGNDLSTSAQLDLQTVSGALMGQQRILRRLVTSDYPFQPEYGAGLPGKIGSPLDLPGLTALVTSQVLLEDAVAKSPPPVVSVTQAADNVSILVNVQYTDAPSGTSQVLNFNVSP